VALSLGSPRAGVTRRLFTVEPGLSSTEQAPPRPPGRLTRGLMPLPALGVNRMIPATPGCASHPAMAQPTPTAPVDPATETPAEREARLAWGRARIAEAEEDIAAGRVIGGQEALDWLDGWTAGENLEDPDIG